MDFQINVFRSLDGEHVIGIARGPMDITGFEQIFREVAEIIQPLPGCEVLIDLRDATYGLEPEDIRLFVNECGSDQWPPDNRVALVAPPETEQHDQLTMLSFGLSSRGVQVAVFHDIRRAINWLAEKR
ncbi:MAG TPA: hypothetical protein VFM35_04575 [Candidatus Binatia bacterium]|nr:hypothetical protein [Candidatus Binatia bacterium]